MDHILPFLPSRLINCWRVQLGRRAYLVTPAHVAVYVKNQSWRMSPLLKELNQMDWRVPKSYVSQFDASKYNIQNDIAWAHLNEGGTDDVKSLNCFTPSSLDLSNECVKSMEFVSVHIHTVLPDRSIFAQNARIYRSTQYSPFWECIGHGFTGISGSIVTAPDGFLGQVIRLSEKPAHPTTTFYQSTQSNTEITQQQQRPRRIMIMPYSEMQTIIETCQNVEIKKLAGLSQR